MAWEHIHYYSQVFIMCMHIISHIAQGSSMTFSRKYVDIVLLTDLLQLEHWVYAKSVHAFMWLHVYIPHADPDSNREEICWMNECCPTFVRVG